MWLYRDKEEELSEEKQSVYSEDITFLQMFSMMEEKEHRKEQKMKERAEGHQ